MAKETLTVRVETETRASLDAIAEAMNRDRSFVINEALSAYLEVFQWQVDHIKKGIAQANAGKFVSEVELRRRVDRLKKR